MSSTMAARRYSMGPLPDPGLRRPGPALRRPRLPLTAITVSAVAHVAVLGGITAENASATVVVHRSTIS